MWLWYGGLFTVPDWLDQNQEWQPGGVEGLADLIAFDSHSPQDHQWGVRRDGVVVSVRFVGAAFLHVPPRRAEIREVRGIDDAVDVAASSTRICLVRKSGRVSCFDTPPQPPFDAPARTDTWTVSSYDLPSIAPSVPTKTSVADATRVVMGSSHGCVLRGGGKVSCWGRNEHDMVGGEAPPIAWTPVEVRLP